MSTYIASVYDVSLILDNNPHILLEFREHRPFSLGEPGRDIARLGPIKEVDGKQVAEVRESFSKYLTTNYIYLESSGEPSLDGVLSRFYREYSNILVDYISLQNRLKAIKLEHAQAIVDADQEVYDARAIAGQ